MNVDELRRLVESQESHERSILFLKNKLRRGHDDDVFTNFRKTAVIGDSTTTQVMITELSKHIVSLVTYLETAEEFDILHIIEHVSDARNYLMLILAFINEQLTFNQLLQNLQREQEQLGVSSPVPAKKRVRRLASHSTTRKSLS